MAMHVITLRGRPATLRQLYVAQYREPGWRLPEVELSGYLAAPSAAKARALFAFYFGSKPSECPEFLIECKRVLV